MKLISLSLAALFLSSSCAVLPNINLSNKQARVLTVAAGSAIVSQAVMQEPKIRPILEVLLAATEDGTFPNYEQFEDPNVQLAMMTVGELVSLYKDDTNAKMVADAIERGLLIASRYQAAQDRFENSLENSK